MFERFKRPAPGDDSGPARNEGEAQPAAHGALGGFGRRQSPVGGPAPLETPPPASTQPASTQPSGGFGRRAVPSAGAAPAAAQPQPPAAPPSQAVSDELKKVSQAGGKIAQLLIQAYRDGRGLHVETIVAAAAALAGEFALRASAPKLPESGWIAGGPADGLMFRADSHMTMWSIVQLALKGAGADASRLPNLDLIASRASDMIGKQFPPKLSVPIAHFPHEFSPNAAPRFRSDVFAIARELGLDPTETALALAFTVSMLIKNAAGLVPIDILALLAAEIMVAMTRVAPLKAPIQ